MGYIDSNYLDRLYKSDHHLIVKMKHAFLLHGKESLTNLRKFETSHDFKQLDFDLCKYRSQCKAAGIIVAEPIFETILRLSQTQSEEHKELILQELNRLEEISIAAQSEIQRELQL